MKLVIAKASDSDRLREFYESITLRGPIDFRIRREGTFFDHYKLQSESFETFMLIDDEDRIQGMTSLIFRRGFVQGEKTTWCLATDLRIAPTRAAVTKWTQVFVSAIKAACEERNCRLIFSAVEHSHNQAYNALIRPNSQARRNLPRYFLMNRFHVITLHGRIPLAEAPLSSIRLSTLQLNEVEALCKYMRKQAEFKTLAGLWEPDDFVSQVSSWPGLKIEDFRVAKDAAGNILGVAALWDCARTQSLIPQTYHGLAQTVHQSLNFASWFGVARPTAQPRKAMQMKMLTHIACESAEVFHRLADDAFSRLGPKEFLAYAHFRGHWRTLPPRSFISANIPYGFYLILPPNQEPPSWVTPDPQWLPPEFEIAWL